MGQTSSSQSSLRSSNSISGNSTRQATLAQEVSSIVKFVQSGGGRGGAGSGGGGDDGGGGGGSGGSGGSGGGLVDSLLPPYSAKIRAFRRFVRGKKKGKGGRGKRRRKSGGGSRNNRDMASALIFNLSHVDVDNVQRSWPKIEKLMLPIGIRVFISILEKRCEKMPVCRQRTCCNNKESPKIKCCPTQVMLNEELQKFVLLLMGIIKRTVKHLDNQRNVVKMLRKVGKKHFTKLNFDLTRLDPDPISLHFVNSVKEIIVSSRLWTDEVEASYILLVKLILYTVQKLSASGAFSTGSPATSNTETETDEYEEDDDFDDDDDLDDDDEDDDDEDGGRGRLRSVLKGDTARDFGLEQVFPAFDRQLVLFGSQTFQDFLDAHPHVMGSFDQFSEIHLTEGVTAADALKMHSSRVLALVVDLIGSAGNPEKVRNMLQDLGRHHRRQGITEEQLDMLGPVVCHTLRPMVFRSGLWSIEVEKSWTHLFDLVAALMKEGHHAQKEEEEEEDRMKAAAESAAAAAAAVGAAGSSAVVASGALSGSRSMARADERLRAVLEEKRRRQGAPPPSSALAAGLMGADALFPTLTHVVILKDTWTGLVQHMHELGLAAVVKLFKINYNLRFYTSPKVRYRPNKVNGQQQQQQHSNGGGSGNSNGGGAGGNGGGGGGGGISSSSVAVSNGRSSEESTEHLGFIFNLLVSILDSVIAAMAAAANGNGSSGSSNGSAGSKDKDLGPGGVLASLSLKQLELLREPMEWIGAVFCNTVRPLLLVQGKWSYQVEMSWILLFRQLVKKRKTTERMTRRPRYE